MLVESYVVISVEGYIILDLIKVYEPPKMICLKTRHIFKSCNIYLKPERFRKSKFTLSKV